jgi:rhomboid protease GluP
MDIDGYEVTVRETWLTRKPAEGSALVAAASFLAIMGASLLFWTNWAGLASSYPASPEQVFEQGQYWRVFTSMLVHGDMVHLLSNAVGLCGLSYLLYGYFSYKIYPCLVLGAGAVVTLITLATYPPHTNLVGASGAIYLMAGFWLTLYICLERRYSLGKRILRSVGFLIIVLIPTSYNPQTSYRAHAIGFGVGVLVAVVYFLFNKDRFRFAEEVDITIED